MKKALTISLYSAVAFGLLTVLSAKKEAAVDGDTTYGFPAAYYIKYGGQGDRASLELDRLLLDLIVAIAIGWLISTLLKLRTSRRKTGP